MNDTHVLLGPRSRIPVPCSLYYTVLHCTTLQTGADREVQRILMELLNQMDGFDQTVNVKVGACMPGRGGQRRRMACCRRRCQALPQSAIVPAARSRVPIIDCCKRAHTQESPAAARNYAAAGSLGRSMLAWPRMPRPFTPRPCSHRCTWRGPIGATPTHPRLHACMRAACVQVIMATNRADTLDPALLRPGRLDRKIEFPMPDRRQKRLIFQVRPGLGFRAGLRTPSAPRARD